MQPPPFHVKQIDHIVLRIADLGKSLRFYRDSLGCTLEKEQPDIGLFQLRAGDSLIAATLDRLLAGEPLVQAVRAGIEAATILISSKGDKNHEQPHAAR